MNKQEHEKLNFTSLNISNLAAQDYPDSSWNRAVKIHEHGDPFCCRTEWALSFHEVFSPLRAVHIFESHGSFLLLASSKKDSKETLFEPLDNSWSFGCPLLGEYSLDMLDLFLQHHAKAEGPYVCNISGLIKGSQLFQKSAKTFRSNYDIFFSRPNIQCYASLEGGIEGYLSRRSGHFRRRLCQSNRKAKVKSVSFERVSPTNHDQVLVAYGRMLAIEEASWKGIGRCGMTSDKSLHFYKAMLKRLSANAAGRIIFAQYDNKDIGFIMGGIAAEVYRGQQFSYAEEWSSYSIGNVLQFEQLVWLCEDGVGRYDMGPLMEYKKHWTEECVDIVTVQLRPK
ncbi:MAG: GNAT family N-acetyltransferase [Planctomycetota bacterium]|nr:GNAT family N-acetyltransferase [Planctomycetota bacterium]